MQAILELVFWVIVIVGSFSLLIHEAKFLANMPDDNLDWTSDDDDFENQKNNKFIRSHHLQYLIGSIIWFLFGIVMVIIRWKYLFV